MVAAVPARQRINLRALRWLVVPAVLLAPPFMMSGFATFELTLMAVWAIAVVSANLLLGFTGQLSIASNASFGLGAYATAILSSDYGMPLVVSSALGAVLAFALGAGLGVVTSRLSELYLAVSTMAVAVLAPQVVSKYASVTGGDAGFVLLRPGAPSWTGLTDDQWYYLLVVAVAVAVFYAMWGIARGPIGRALTAVREGELVARSQGIDAARLKVIVGGLSSAGVAIAGSMYVIVVGIISPQTIGIMLSINLIVALVVGGAASIGGTIVGAAFLQYIPKIASDIGAEWGGVVFGVTVMVVVLVAPSGTAGLAKSLRRRMAQ